MFDQMLESRKGGSGDRSPWAFPIALAVHVLAIGAIIAGSYVIVEAVQDPDLMISFIGGAPPPPPPPPPRPPELIFKKQPEYPEMARRARIEGRVILEAIINSNGDVENVKVLRSIPLLDNAAITAVKQWKYKPALQHGRPVKVFFTVMVDFTLR